MSENTSDHLNITYGGQPRELLMSFGLLNELLTVVNSLEGVAVIGVNHEMRQRVLGSVLSLRDKKGETTEPADLDKISTADAHRLFEWVGHHTLDFFLTEIETLVKVHQPQEQRMKATSVLSSTGSQS